MTKHKEPKDMTDKELLEEFNKTDDLIHGENCCYSLYNLVELSELQKELDRRAEK